MSSDSLPAYEELLGLVGVLTARLDVLEEQLVARDARIAELEAENGELRRRLGMNSMNSSQPPSADSPFTKPAPRSLRSKTGRRPGGQPGHRGATLALVDDPGRVHETLEHEPLVCGGCGAGLAGAESVGYERRQVFDLPPISVQVTEHRLMSRRCGCAVVTTAAAPGHVWASVQYGPRIQAIILYLYVGQFLSKQRTAQALSELFGTPVSAGTVAAVTGRAAGRLDEFCALVREQITAAPVAGFDETGLRVAGALRWVHVSRTDELTLITCHDKRGRKGIDDNGVLTGFTGVAVHDAWAPYDCYDQVAGHQLCCSHVLRELRAVVDNTPGDTEWCWAAQVSDALVALERLVTDAAGRPIDPGALAEQIHLYRSAATIGLAEIGATTALGKKQHSLAKRLLDRQDDYLRFTTDPRIPADNNGSERDIRMIKLRQKVSGCLRATTGADHFCRLRSYISTATKQSRRLFDTLVELTEGKPWLPTPC